MPIVLEIMATRFGEFGDAGGVTRMNIRRGVEEDIGSIASFLQRTILISRILSTEKFRSVVRKYAG